MDNARGLIKALENWAKRVTSGYKDVDVRNMSSSFRDGLAFCAIIHHYRSDLIDFDSLCKENIFENNSLAFSVAEKQLGVPALLDAEDMVKYSCPDKLSIITYLSQLHNCFENQNRVRNEKTGIKRVIKSNASGPPVKVPSITPQKRHEVCQVCKNRVFLLERLIVDGKLYHTTCFRCSKCKKLLNPGAYVESDSPGLYECTVCLHEEDTDEHDVSETSMKFKDADAVSDSLSSISDYQIKNETPVKQSSCNESVTQARHNFLSNSLTSQGEVDTKVTPSVSPVCNLITKNVENETAVQGTSVKDKINVFEANQVCKSVAENKSSISSNKLYHSPLLTNVGEKSPNSLNFTFNKFSSISPKPVLQNEVASKEQTISAKNLFAKNLPLSIARNDDLKDGTDGVQQSSLSSETITKKENETTCVPKSPIKNNLSSVGQVTFDSNLNKLQSKNLESNKLSSQESFMDEYKSPLKISRNIFQSNLQYLNIPSVSLRKESKSLPATPLTTDFKGIKIPEIKAAYSTSLPRPNSLASFRLKEGVKDENQTIIRSRSFDMNVDSEKSTNMSPEASSVHLKDKKFNHERNNVKHFSTEVDAFQRAAIIKSSYFENESKLTPLSIIDAVENTECDDKHDSSAAVNHIRKSTINENLNSEMMNKNTDMTSSNVDSACTSGDSSRSDVNSLFKSNDKLEASNLKDEEEYPDDLNPFGDEDEVKDEYPDDLNPFGDEEEGKISTKIVSVDDYDESKNPFASDDEKENVISPPAKVSASSLQPPLIQDSIHFSQDSISSHMSSPTGSLKGTTKKRQAPKPPNVRDIFPKDSLDSEADVSYSSVSSSPASNKKSLQTPSPKLRKNKPAPLPPSGKQNSVADIAASRKQAKEIDNIKLQTSAMEEYGEKEPEKIHKKKKRPAPPVPIPVRRNMKKIPLKEILREVKEIEEKQREYEKQGREIELLIRDRDKDEEPTVEEEEYIMQLFELVNQKNALFRRQAELMYIKRSQRLEEQQYEVEKQIRLLMAKPESERTEEEKEREEELTMELIDIVDQRNSIIDSIEMDRRRELEEDVSVQEQLEIKNAEIKEKSSGKTKKSKHKKDKKKRQENGSNESGKNTLKRKWLSKVS